MKKLLIILLSLFVSINSLCQEKDYVSFQYSQGSIIEGTYILGGIFGAVFSLGHFNFDNTISTGCLSIGYNHKLNKTFDIGGLISFETISSDTYNTDSEGNKNYTGKYNLSSFTIIPNTNIRWFDKKNFGMYSKIGIGFGILYSEECSLIPAFQLSPVCIDFGNSYIRGITELGFGSQGIITVGIKKYL